MDVTLDNLTTRKVFKEISKGVSFDERTLTTPIHLSDLTRCITKAYLQRLHATEGSIPSSEELMDDKSIIFMYLGTLAEEALSRIKPLVEKIEVDGITGRADWVIDGDFTELKMTRMNVVRDKGKSTYMLPKKGIPGEWLRRIAGYSYMYEEDWKLSMLLIIPGDIVTYSFHWTEEELTDILAEVHPASEAYYLRWRCNRNELQNHSGIRLLENVTTVNSEHGAPLIVVKTIDIMSR